jgi:hypothetical protein
MVWPAAWAASAVAWRHDVQMPHGGRKRREVAGVVLFGLPMVLAVVLVAGRVGATARFVSWPVVVFTALAATVALVGVWVGLERPGLFAAGVAPGLVVSYVLPAAPFSVVAGVLVGLAALAVGARGVAAGTAMTVGATMVLAVVMQGPAVKCGDSSVSSGSGPWWIRSPSASSGSGTGVAGGGFSGTTQVGDHRYAYACVDGRLTRFERVG